MQNSSFTKNILAIMALSVIPLAIYAQENTKEVHIKVVENGVVTKDTVYTYTGDMDEFEHMETVRMRHRDHERMPMVEKHVFIMNDSLAKDFEWTSEGSDFEWTSNDSAMEKEVRVIVHGGDGENTDVKEIWLDNSDEDRPCRTIIIHEGNCPGHGMDVRVFEGMDPGHTPPPPPHAGNKQGKSETKVIRTQGGQKVIIIETTDDSSDKKEKN